MTTLRIDQEDGGASLLLTVPDGGSVSLDSAAVSALIGNLLALRARMTPPLAAGAPRPGDPVAEHPQGCWFAGARSDARKGMVLMVSHPGLGWVRVHLSAEDAQKLAHTIPLFLFEEAAGPKQ